MTPTWEVRTVVVRQVTAPTLPEAAKIVDDELAALLADSGYQRVRLSIEKMWETG